MTTAVEPSAVALEADWHDWLQIIRSEYLEMPRLCLTLAQAQRLWTLDQTTCRALLTALLETGFLRCTPNGQYCLREPQAA